MARQRTLVNLVSKSKVHKKEVPHFCFNAMMKGSKKDMLVLYEQLSLGKDKKRFDSLAIMKFGDSNYRLRPKRKAQVPYFAGAYSSLGGTMVSINCGTRDEYRCGKGIIPIHFLNKTNRSLISCTDSGATSKIRYKKQEHIALSFGGSSE